jgi:hypothetical protein
VSGQRKALIVANDQYEQSALRDLLAPAADAEALGRVLGDRQVGDFTVQVVRNEPSYIIQALIEELFSESRSDDVLLVHFSGHGLKSESGELFFAAANTRPNRLGSTAVSADFVQRCMQTSRSRSVVLLLDCCYGGAFAQGVQVRAAGDINVLDSFPHETRSAGGRGRAVITASSAMEFAFEGDRLGDDQHRRPSVFTNALVEGLATGDADRDEDGWVSLNELYDYIFDKVREQNPHQTPSRQVQLEGEMYLARSRRQRIRPAPLPPDLQVALTDPNMYSRLGALSELRSRLASDNLPTAVGAYEALVELARNDIQAVADPAAAALKQAALHPEEKELHFGERRQGSVSPHRTVRLLGLPIARACASRPSHDWIRVDETDEGFDISIDTTNVGTLRGTLDLKGPTGEAAIAIDVELLPSTQAPLPPPSEAARQQTQQVADSGQAKPPAPPELELSATVLDFGKLFLHGESPEHMVRLRNAGGGSLNARAATHADWVKLRQDGDELLVSVDTSATGEHQSSVTIDSDGGSATIRVQALVVPDAPTGAGADTRHRSISSETPGQSAASTNASAVEPSATDAADVKETSEDQEHVSLGRPPRIQPVGSAMQEAETPPDLGRTPVRQPRRISMKAWIFGGAFAGIVLLVVLIVVLTSSHTPSPPPNSTPSSAFPFREDFSSRTNDWTVYGAASSGQYINGQYQIHLKPIKGAYAFASPLNVARLSPAPQNITIDVSAGPAAGSQQLLYGIACRSNSSSSNDYELHVTDGYVSIVKYVNYKTKVLDSRDTSTVHAYGTNQLRLACNVDGLNAVRLVAWINGTKLLDVTDRNNPSTHGKAGIVVTHTNNQRKAATAEFDNFVVTKN